MVKVMEKDRETLQNEIIDTLDDLYKKYKLPPQKISNLEWNAFFDVTYEHFLKRNKTDEYEYALNLLIRRALYFAQLDKCGEFNINHLKKSLVDLPVYNIYSSEIDLMRNEIDEKSNDSDLKIKLRTILNQAINDECKSKPHIPAPDFISEDEWFVLFDVLEAHYIANDMMDKYLRNMYWYVRQITYWAEVYKDDIAKLFAYVNSSDVILDSFENVIRYREGRAIEEEIKEKLDKLHAAKQGKKYVKQ